MAILPSFNQMGTNLKTGLQNVSYALGSAIDKLPGPQNQSGSLFGNNLVDVSKSLQNFKLVKPASASSGEWTGSYGVQPPSGQVLGTTTNSGGINYSQPSQYVPQNTQQDNGGYNGPSEMDVINGEYDAFNQTLNEQESIANQGFTNFQGQVTSQRDQDLTKVGNQQTAQNTQIDNTAAQGRATERLNLQKMRQMLADLEQRNAAQSAIGGGGSMNEALADRFSRTSQQGIGGILNEGQRYQNDLGLERTRTNQFFEQKKTEISEWARNKIEEGRFALQENLAAIAASRRDSGMAKQRDTMDAWKSFYNNVNQAKLQAANFMSQYNLWKQGQDAKINEAISFQVQAPNGMNFTPAIGAVNDALNTRGITSTAQQTYAPVKTTPGTKTEDEELYNPYQV